jgi:hypothetical protein
MSEKANSAVNAASDTPLKLGMRLQDRVQRELILLDKRLSAVVLVPVRAKRENFLDRYNKKARFSVRIRNVTFTPSSYLVDAKASRGRARFFVAARELCDGIQALSTQHPWITQALLLATSRQFHHPAPLELAT